uniref:Homologous-pairing protein 2 homolog n=1 Tax=Polytomella parva TaxID=51329 RepID=A0A7S0YNC8_9CHLO|mmetsp:Transcript_29691/g.54436  ORF Transcript_29691/g.54436 Transcript_29691/m.54436 type:complete len:233 (+) Transcript_29691:105-803(+)
MSSAAAEAAVLNLLQQQNKPFSLQNVVDLLAHAGFKKAQITKALDNLGESQRIIVKEFGKTKLFLPNQTQFSVLSKEEYDLKKNEIKELQEAYQKEAAELKDLEQELQQWKNSLSDEELELEIKRLSKQLDEQQCRIVKLSSGAALIPPEERQAVEKRFALVTDIWRKRRSIFDNIWGPISEGLEGKTSDLFEEIGVDTDASLGVSLPELEKLVSPSANGSSPHSAKRLRRT